MSETVVTSLLSRQQRMEEVRDGFEGQQQKAFDYVNPRRYDLAGTRVKGAQRRTKMYDGTAQDAFYDWVDGMLGWGVSESLQWQRAAISDRRWRDSDAVQRFLDEYTEQMDWEFRQSNFYNIEPEWLQDAGSGGTGTVVTEEAKDLRAANLRVPHPGKVWIAENADGRVNVYHEKVTMTARQALERYSRPGDTLHGTIRKWANDPASSLWEATILQCILPADDGAVFEKRPTYKPWALISLLYEMHGGAGVTTSDLLVQDPGDRLIRVEGLDYFSPTVWRFRKNSDELYGYSPAMDVMTAIEALQQHGYNLLNMGNFASNPILAAPDEGRTQFSRLPGSTYWYGAETRVPQVIEMAREYPVAVDREERIQALVRKRYGWHVWNAVLALQNKKERVQATEVNEVRADQARLITGQFNNFWRSGIKPIYNNVAKIAARGGRLPEPPAELADQGGKDLIDIDFIGPLSVIQIYASKLGGLQQGLRLLGEVGEIVGRHIGPEEAAQLYARVNLPDLAEYVCDHSGFPQRLMRTDEETAAIIRRRQEQLAAAEQARNARELAAASAQMGKPVARNSLLAGVA